MHVWQADEYLAKFSFVPQYGEDVLTLLDCPEGARVVDLGCGTGELTARLRDRGWTAVGVDQSPEMLALARRRYPDIEFVESDMTEYSDRGQADAVFSNAAFHWVDGSLHDRLLDRVAASLRPGGQLVFECGGRGCAETVHAALEASFRKRRLEYPRTFYFPTVGEYAPRMEKAGLTPVFAALFRRWTRVTGVDDWIRMFIRAPFEGMDGALADEIIAEAAARARASLFRDGSWHVDYVRLRVKAIRSLPSAHDVAFLP